MQDRAGPRLCFEPVHGRPRRLAHALEQLSQFADTDREGVQGLQIGVDLADGQAQRGAQVGDQAGDADAEPALAEHLAV